MVGEQVGTLVAVGLFVGTVEGVSVEGCNEGARVVGAEDGDSVGAAVGTVLGISLSTMVGDRVGWMLGSWKRSVLL